MGRVLNFDDLFDRHGRYVIRASKKECHFDPIEFPRSNELNRAIDCFKISSVGSVAGPLVRSLEVEPGRDVPQKCFHTHPFRNGGPKHVLASESQANAVPCSFFVEIARLTAE